MKSKELMDRFHVAGIDAGGTKTECAIVDQDGRCVGLGRGGPSRDTYVGLEKSLESLEAAIRQALAGAGTQANVVLAACTHKLARHPEVQRLVLELLGAEVRDYSEGEAALGCVGVFERFGIAHVAGTGVCTWGYSKNGEAIQVGGWGMLLGDEGGGYDIAVKGLRAAVRSMDGRGPETMLLEAACGHFGLAQDRDAFVEHFTSTDSRHVIASFAPCVTAAACDGDPAAVEIVDSAAREDANCILAAARRLFSREDSFPIALHGGVMSDARISDGVIRLVREGFPNADMRRPTHSPGVGLALFALRNIGS